VKADGTGPAAFITPGGHVRNNSMKKISVEKIQIELEKILTKKRREAILFGQIYAPKDSYYLGVFHGLVDWPFSLGDDIDRAHFMVPVAFTIPKLILMSYGEIINSSWLWRPPEWFEINAASEIMYGLTINDEERAMRSAAVGRALSFLGRLKLVRIEKARLSLGVGGRRFIGKL
jgi:hypothetical protein